jgi:hypothetical protein
MEVVCRFFVYNIMWHQVYNILALLAKSRRFFLTRVANGGSGTEFYIHCVSQIPSITNCAGSEFT